MSSMCSVPIDRRIVDGVMCCASSSSGDSCEWVVVYGCITRLFTSATFARSEKIFRASINFQASSCPPFISNVKMLPPPLGKYFLYSSWSGWLARAGWFTCATFGCLLRKSTTFRAFSTCLSTRRLNVSTPCNSMKALNGDIVARCLPSSRTCLHQR